jgi:hypothetical protein
MFSVLQPLKGIVKWGPKVSALTECWPALLLGGGLGFIAARWAPLGKRPRDEKKSATLDGAAAPQPISAAEAPTDGIARSREAYEYNYFISYNKSQIKNARLVADILQKQGKRHWVQFYDSKMSDHLEQEIHKAIKTSQHFIALLCREYIPNESWTEKERRWFEEDSGSQLYRERRLIVLKCDNMPERRIPRFFKDVYYGELSGKSEPDKRAVIRRALERGSAEERSLPDDFDPEIRPAEGFTGRVHEIAGIARHFFPEGAEDPVIARHAGPPREPRRVLLHAGPGFGKTSLARKFAHQYGRWFYGAYWLPSENRATLLDAIVRKLQVPAKMASEGATMETALQVLQARFGGVEAPYLLIFDNVDSDSQQTVEALVARLPPSVRVISTARSRDWDAIAKRIELRKLDRDDGAALLRKRADRENDDINGSLSLAVTLAGWPLALSHAGAFCKQSQETFAEYEQRYKHRLEEAPEGIDYERGAVHTTVRLGLDYAAGDTGAAPGDVQRLADLLSYCSAERIPKSLYKQAVADEHSLNSAVRALREQALVQQDVMFADELTLSMHRAVQQVIRRDADTKGRSASVVDRLVPFLYGELASGKEGTAAGKDLRHRKYFPHLLQALPELDAPDFRGNETSNILDDVAKLIVLALTRQFEAESKDSPEEPYPERLPGLLGCFYEVDPLGKPLELLLERLHARPENWRKFRDACLDSQNYVLRFALADALAAAVEAGLYDLSEVTRLLDRESKLNHFELGGYALKSLYSNPDTPRPIDSCLLGRLAEHKCYPGRSILGDLLLNLVNQKRDAKQLLPPHEGENARFWQPIWDFVSYDVNAIRAAEYRNNGEAPPASESKEVKDEYAYLSQLEAWRGELREEPGCDPSIAAILDKYFEIGAHKALIENAEDSFKELGKSGKLLPMLRLLFGHPLWSVAETAASVAASLLREAKAEGKTAEVRGYVEIIESLFEQQLPWRVRYGAMEAAFQIRLNDEPRHATFFKGVKDFRFYCDQSSKMRGLCAENLLSIILNASDKQRASFESQFEPEIRAWLVDEDCWVLEHVYRYFHALHLRNANVERFMSGPRSPLVAGLDKWWTHDRETFLEHIETKKEERIRLQ